MEENQKLADSPSCNKGDNNDNNNNSTTHNNTSKYSNDETSKVEAEKPDKETTAQRSQTKDKKKDEAEIKYTLKIAFEDIQTLLPKLSTPKEDALEIPDLVEKYLDLIDDKLPNHELPLLDDDGLLLKVVDQLSKLYKNLCQGMKFESDQGLLINRIGRIQQRAMFYLEEEFKYLLEESINTESDKKQEVQNQNQNQDQDQDQTADQQTNEESNFPGYSQEVLANLNKIAKTMISGGYESECSETYMVTRRNLIDETLNKLGYEKISIDEAQKMQWEALEKEILQWIKAFKLCVNVYFSCERKLVDAVFSDYPSLSPALFSNLARGVFIHLLNFAEAVTTSKRSTEKLFKIVDIYETLRDNISAINGVFPEESAKDLITETITTRCRIGETAICIFCDLENAIESDTGKTPVPGGAVHPLTRYTMNYLKYACDEYKETIEQVFKDHFKTERHDSTSRPWDYEGDSQYNDENQSPFVAQVLRILDLLDSALEAKSKLYKDVALSSIFMMNNGRYMLQKIKASDEIHQAMRDTWCRKTSSDLMNYHQTYKRETWMRLLGTLKTEGLNVNEKIVKPLLKERFKSFNAMFDEIHKTQSLWVVNDKQLQSELRVSISAIVIPAYRSFLARFSGYFSPGRQTEKYVKFQPEDIETCINELFDGNSASIGRKKS